MIFKIRLFDLVKKVGFDLYLKSDPELPIKSDPDPKLSVKLDPDPKEILSDPDPNEIFSGPTHWLTPVNNL